MEAQVLLSLEGADRVPDPAFSWEAASLGGGEAWRARGLRGSSLPPPSPAVWTGAGRVWPWGLSVSVQSPLEGRKLRAAAAQVQAGTGLGTGRGWDRRGRDWEAPS